MALITVSEVAKIYGVNPLTVRRWIDAGRITAYQIGPNTIRLDAEQVAEQLLNHPVQTHSRRRA
jgi:excisionase family DNA binding protein